MGLGEGLADVRQDGACMEEERGKSEAGHGTARNLALQRGVLPPQESIDLRQHV